MQHVRGRIFWNVQLPGMESSERAAIYEQLATTLAALHRVDPAAVGLSDYGKQGRYVARQIERWTAQYRASEIDAVPAMDALIAWLPIWAIIYFVPRYA